MKLIILTFQNATLRYVNWGAHLRPIKKFANLQFSCSALETRRGNGLQLIKNVNQPTKKKKSNLIGPLSDRLNRRQICFINE
jgi:hypothetical protein